MILSDVAQTKVSSERQLRFVYVMSVVHSE